MPGLFRNLPNTREGKYPVLLRSDGTVPEWEHFCLGARDPAAPDAIRAYSRECERRNMDPDYVRDLVAMALSWEESQQDEAERRGRWEAARSAGEAAAIEGIFPFPKPADPDGPRHRTDDPDVLAFPGTLAEYRAKVRAEAFEEAAALVAAWPIPMPLDPNYDPNTARPTPAAMLGIQISGALTRMSCDEATRSGSPGRRTGRSA